MEKLSEDEMMLYYLLVDICFRNNIKKSWYLPETFVEIYMEAKGISNKQKYSIGIKQLDGWINAKDFYWLVIEHGEVKKINKLILLEKIDDIFEKLPNT